MRSSYAPRAAATFVSLAGLALALSACSDATAPTAARNAPTRGPSLDVVATLPAIPAGSTVTNLASNSGTQWCGYNLGITQTTSATTFTTLPPTPAGTCEAAIDLTAALAAYNPGWSAPLAGSSWIGPRLADGLNSVGNGTSNEYKPRPGAYEFTTTFNVPAGATSPLLNLTIKSDNDVIVYLNGTNIGQNSPITDCITICNWNTTLLISQSTGFVTGTNTLRIDLIDTPIGFGNPNPGHKTCADGPPPTAAGHFVVPYNVAACPNPTGLDFVGTASFLPPPAEGCSPGFYKKHDMPGGNLLLANVFIGSGYTVASGVTLHDALFFSGGPDLQDAKNVLLRQAAAAYANSIRLAGAYPLTTAQVIAQTNAALASGDRDTILAFADVLDGFNNLEGPRC